MQLHERIRMSVIEAARSLGQYIVSILITNTLLALAIWGAFAWLGVHHALAWGVAAALLHCVPYLGPVVTVLASAVAAGFQFGSVLHGALIGIVVAVLSTLICVLLQAWLTARSVRMNTGAVLVAVLLFSALWGIVGLVLAIPVLIVLRAVFRQIPPMHWFETLVGQRARDSAARRDGATAGALALPRVTSGKR